MDKICIPQQERWERAVVKIPQTYRDQAKIFFGIPEYYFVTCAKARLSSSYNSFRGAVAALLEKTMTISSGDTIKNTDFRIHSRARRRRVFLTTARLLTAREATNARRGPPSRELLSFAEATEGTVEGRGTPAGEGK